MEFPTLGRHCSVKKCNRLDFLPMKCNLCSAVLCKDHILYAEHQCPSSYRKKVEISVCRSCNKGISLQNRDQLMNVTVSDDINDKCKCNPSLRKRGKVYSYKCSVISCKQCEAIEVKCDKCLKIFCLKHRFPGDHKCQGRSGDVAIESINSIVENKNQSTRADDELLTLASKLSLNQTTQEENDFLLAKVLQEMEQEDIRRNRAIPMVTTSNNNHRSKRKKTCSIL